MNRQLLFTAIFCLMFTTSLSLRCYLGTDAQCYFGPDTTDCGDGERCKCVKYRFQCTSGDQACTQQQQNNGTVLWAYSVVAKSTCKMMEQSNHVYLDTKCCSRNGCNKPKNTTCSSGSWQRRHFLFNKN